MNKPASYQIKYQYVNHLKIFIFHFQSNFQFLNKGHYLAFLLPHRDWSTVIRIAICICSPKKFRHIKIRYINIPEIAKLCNVVKYWNELLWTEKNYAHNKLVSSAVIRSQNAKIKNKINIHFAFSERPDPHQLKFVQFFSTQPISTYFTLQRYIALV